MVWQTATEFSMAIKLWTRGKKLQGRPRPPALTRMLTRDLFAVANLAFCNDCIRSAVEYTPVSLLRSD